MPETRSLHRKLAQVMYEAERIPKNGTAPREMGGYKFVQVGDAADYIRKALAEKVLTMMPTAVHVVGQQDRLTKSGGNMTTVDLVTEWTITDGESGESITIMSFGAGADGGDKYSGKAMTSAMKYALLSGFLLSTGEDTEGSSLPEQRPSGTEGPIVLGQQPAGRPAPEHLPDRRPGSLVGFVGVGDKMTSDYMVRPDPGGVAHIGFRLLETEDGKKGFLVEASGELAEDLMVVRDSLVGKRVTCWGLIEPRSIPGKPGVTYQALVLSRLTGPDGLDLPAATDAPSLPLGLEDEIDALPVLQ